MNLGLQAGGSSAFSWASCLGVYFQLCKTIGLNSINDHHVILKLYVYSHSIVSWHNSRFSSIISVSFPKSLS